MTLIRDEQDLRDRFGIDFTAPQVAAITAPLDRPSAIIAGAGSGKTTVMAARVVWLVGHVGVAPDQILGLTFTNKAAAQLGQKVRAGLEFLDVELDGEPTTATYHAFAGQLIAEHGLRLGIEPDLRLVADASRFQRMARAIETYDGDLRELSTHVPTLVTQAIALDGQLAEHLASPDALRVFDNALIDQFRAADDAGKAPTLLRDAADTARKRIELSHLVDRYRLAKADAGVMDFSDQMAWGAQLAALPEVGEALRARFGVVLLDEYQDTSVAQRDLLKALFSGADETCGRGHPVTAVGDPAQAIYGWRGAAAANLEQFLDDFPATDGAAGRLFSLIKTQRCSPVIIDAANALAAEFYATSKVVRPLESAVTEPGTVDVGLYATVEDEIAAMIAAIRAETVPLRDIAILVRVGRENGAIVQALRAADIPFEIVGLEGLLSQPEVLDLLAVLEIVEDVTANPAMLRLLTGPRWRIGTRDLALLGRRAATLSGRTFGRDDDTTLEAELTRAVAGTDPTEIVALADAVDEPGELPYSAEALIRFTEVSRLIASIRRHASEPLIELARRSIRALDLDLELEAGGIAGGSDNIALLLEAISDYAQSDRYASLSGLVAYLAAEDFYNEGMSVATPSEAQSVKLLTIHRAKGLEWHSVYVPLTSSTIFPSTRGRGRWTATASALPNSLRGDRDSLPSLGGWTPADSKAFSAANSADSRMEERRLGYVAFTRAARRLVVTGHWWGRTQQKPLGPSEYLLSTREWLTSQQRVPLHWAAPPPDDATNPHLVEAAGIAWPATAPALVGRRALAAAVRSAAGATLAVPVAAGDPAELARLDELANDVDLLLAEVHESQRALRKVPWPVSMSATTAMALQADPEQFARDLARPMPRRPSSAARFGTRFHAWVEAHFGQQTLLDPTDLPGRGDVGIDTDAELEEVKAAFLAGPYADLTPVQIEAPFSLVLGGQQFVGRIDAVFSTSPSTYEVVDWKTNKQAGADPLQLAIYRLAWAELMRIEPAAVTASFYYARLGEVQTFTDLPDRVALERQLGLSAGDAPIT